MPRDGAILLQRGARKARMITQLLNYNPRKPGVMNFAGQIEVYSIYFLCNDLRVAHV
jgi:hypothetical protein